MSNHKPARSGGNFPVQVKETRRGIEKSILSTSLPARGLVAMVSHYRSGDRASPDLHSAAVSARPDQHKSILVLLIMTGLATMGMEVIWIRLFTPYLGAIVYSFASILASYLLATFIGSRVYRAWSRIHG